MIKLNEPSYIMADTPSFKPYTTNKPIVYCEGDKNDKHPKVYLNVPPKSLIHCPYCRKAFEKSS